MDREHHLKPALRSILALLAAILGIPLVTTAVVFPIGVLVGPPGEQRESMLAAIGVYAVIALVAGVPLIRYAGKSLRYTRVLLIGVGMVLVLCIGILGSLQHQGHLDRSKVVLANGVLLIQGRLDQELLGQFRRVLEAADVHDVRVRLRSPGGETWAAMAMGLEIHRRQLDVEVDRRCISSCANYLFTAGRNKYLHSVEHVKFHGGALQPNFIPEALKLIEQGTLMKNGEDLPPDLDLQQLRKLYGLVDDFPINRATHMLVEKAFFDEIGVSSLTPVYGQYGDYAAWFNDGVHDDFYYLPEDYALLGVTNLNVTGQDGGSDRRLFRARTNIEGIKALQAQMDAVYQKIEAAVPFGAGEIWRGVAAAP